MSAGRSPITTHVLDVSLGRPAAGVAIELYRVHESGSSIRIGMGETDADGRLANLLPARPLQAGRYRLDFAVGAYFAASGRASLYPSVSILFEVAESAAHYHIPLLLSPFGYSTYRGS
jgi:5-hydroxyisourate hydrolase